MDPLRLAEKLVRAGEILLVPRVLRPVPLPKIQAFLEAQARRLVRTFR